MIIITNQKNCFNFIPLINDLVIKFSAVLSANVSSSRKNLLRKQCGLEPRLFKYYVNRFGSVMEVANNIIDNFDMVKEFVTKLSVNKKKKNNNYDNDDNIEDNTRLNSVKSAYNNDCAYISLLVLAYFFKDFPQLIHLFGTDNLLPAPLQILLTQLIQFKFKYIIY